MFAPLERKSRMAWPASRSFSYICAESILASDRQWCFSFSGCCNALVAVADIPSIPSFQRPPYCSGGLVTIHQIDAELNLRHGKAICKLIGVNWCNCSVTVIRHAWTRDASEKDWGAILLEGCLKAPGKEYDI